VSHNTVTSLQSLVGNTPLFRLRTISERAGPSVYVKLEQFNPGGSIKDRTALGMIRAAESADVLRPGMQLIESSSGNTAIGLAMLATERGYRVTAICDRYLPATKRARLMALGADIVFLPDTPVGMDTVELRIAVANSLAQLIPNSISLGQYSNSANPEIHYRTTGPEIWRDLGGKVSAVVVAVGTCGTISGVGRYLKEQNPQIQVIGVEPEGSIIFGGHDGRYFIQGGGLSFIPTILDRSVIDEGRKVSDSNAIRAVHRLAAMEGWMIGGTGGLVVHVLSELAQRFGPNDNIVGIIPDAGERYLDTIYDHSWLERNGFKDSMCNRSQSVGTEAVEAIGCSLNDIPEGSTISIKELCDKMAVRYMA
jgi:cysteine synthase